MPILKAKKTSVSKAKKPLPVEKAFKKEADKIKKMTLDKRFQHIYETNFWGSDESRSGVGSTLEATEVLRKGLINLLLKIGADSILDAPCGDFNWFKEMPLDLESYVGVDIVPQLIEANQSKYGNRNRVFSVADLTKDTLSKADIILCRDCLVHLSFKNISKVLENFKSSGSRYLLMTHFTEVKENVDIVDGSWHPLNFELAPFNFPKPLTIIVEECKEGDGSYKDKSLALWELKNL